MNRQRALLFIPLILFVVLALLFWRGLSLDPNYMPSALLNKPVPNFDLPVLAAEENPKGLTHADQSVLKGRVSLLNVWATWCITCRQEHEFLVTLKRAGVAIYGVNYKDNDADAEAWLAKLHNPYIFSLVDADGHLGIDLGVYGAPETYVVDKQGVIRYKHIGDVNQQVWETTLKPLMAQLNRESN